MNRLSLGVVFFAIACASAPQGSDLPVTREEIDSSHAATVYDVLSDLRPRWLYEFTERRKVGVVMTREQMRAAPNVDSRCRWAVYVDDDGYEIDYLRRLPALSVQEIRLLPPLRRRPDGVLCPVEMSVIQVVPVGAGGVDRRSH